MELLRRAVGKYWVIYYLVYVGGVGCGLWRYWERLQSDEGIYLLASIFGVAVGIALLAAILVEVIGRMVLLIPAAWNKAKAEGRAEERDRASLRLKEAYERLASKWTAFSRCPARRKWSGSWPGNPAKVPDRVPTVFYPLIRLVDVAVSAQ